MVAIQMAMLVVRGALEEFMIRVMNTLSKFFVAEVLLFEKAGLRELSSGRCDS